MNRIDGDDMTKEYGRKEGTPLQKLLSYVGRDKPRLIGSVLLSIGGVVFGIIPYAIAANILEDLISQSLSVSKAVILCLVAFGCYLLKTVFVLASTRLSHHIAYRVLEDLRGNLAARLTPDSAGQGDFCSLWCDQEGIR